MVPLLPIGLLGTSYALLALSQMTSVKPTEIDKIMCISFMNGKLNKQPERLLQIRM